MSPCPRCGCHHRVTELLCPHCHAPASAVRTAAAALLSLGLATGPAFGGEPEPLYGVPDTGVEAPPPPKKASESRSGGCRRAPKAAAEDGD